MVFITWDDSYSVYVESIDEQHKKLMRMINDLHDSLNKDEESDAIIAVLGRLRDYSREHFKYEEDIFRKYGYQHEQEHKKRHDDLVQNVNEFENKLLADRGEVGEELLNFLLYWLENHIKNVDKQYITFMLENGVK